jgi:hypothetical protein
MKKRKSLSMPVTRKTLSDQQIRAIQKALVEFGYTDLTEKTVRSSAEKILKGEEPEGVIGMFVKSFLEEAKLI